MTSTFPYFNNTTHHFDDRELRVVDNGSDFETFVYETLAIAGDQTSRLKPAHGRGRDGAIDLLDDTTAERCVIECKFIGCDSTSDGRHRWTDVYRNLKSNLIELASADADRVARSPYGPWLDQERPILKYVFCVTESFTNSNDEEALRKSIKNDFHTLSEAHPGLHHLENTEVVVYGWNFFLAELTRRLPLKYRWFGGLPLGLSALFQASPRSGPFKQFLNGEKLPFFSRTRFHREQGRSKADTEEDLINALEQPDQDEVLILSGPGGVGKTRLALEIGRTLQQRGWLVLMLSERASPQVIADIAKANSESCQVVLILDYAEASSGIADLAETIRSVNDAGHSFRLIATCRSSALTTVQDGLAELNSRLLVLDAAHTVEKTSFNEWVVTRILEHGGVPAPSRISLVCDGLPVLAAFAVYVFQRHKLAFETQLKNLVGEQGFSSWARHRLQILEDVFPSSSQPAKVLAELAFQLPITLPEASNIREQGGIAADLLERLKDDLWIEEHEGTLVGVHDVFADAIAASYIFEAGRSAQDRAATILRGASLKGYFERAVTCFIRLGTHPDFNKIDRLKIVKELFITDEEKLLPHSNLLIRFGLLSKREILTLLAEYSSLRTYVMADSKCDMAVARLAQYVNTSLRTDARNNDEFRRMTVEVLTPLMDNAIARNKSSDFIISHALSLDQERYKKHTLDRIHSSRWSRTGMLFEAWLKSDLPISEIEDEFKTWLSLYGESLAGAAFVYRACLAREIDLSLVTPYIHKWLSKNGTSVNAGLVFTALTYRSEDNDSVLKYFLPWLVINYKYAGAGRVIGGWLLKGGDPESIKPYVCAWLKLHSDRYVAGFLCKTWLEATGDYALVQDYIQAWLVQFAAESSAVDVLMTCIRVTKDYSQFGNTIGIWLQANHETPKAIAFCEELMSCINPDTTLDDFLTTLSINPNNYETAVFFNAWLKRSSDIQSVWGALLCWLEIHSDTQLAGNIYKRLAQHDTDISPIYPHLKNWLDTRWEQQETGAIIRSLIKKNLHDLTFEKLLAQFDWVSSDDRSLILYESWIRTKGANHSIEPHIDVWLGEHRHDIQAGRLYKALLTVSKEGSWIDTHADAWLDRYADKNEAVPVYVAWFDSKRNPAHLARHLQTWLTAGHDISPDAGLFYRAWIKASGDISVIGKYLADWLETYQKSPDGRFIVEYLLNNSEQLEDYFLHHANQKLKDLLANFTDDFAMGFEIGQVHTGRIKGVTHYGVFIDIGGVEGLLHLSEMSWSKINIVPINFTEIDSEVNVQIIKINCVKRRVHLSIKHLLPDPWKMIPSKHSVGEVVYGKVANKVDYGIFVELEPGIEGLLHKSKIPGAEEGNLKLVYPIGSNINVRVTEVDEIRRRLALELYPPPEQTGYTETGN